jgi:MoaA/NifB/PqqE/SkfB family radical SAM enzyme
LKNNLAKDTHADKKLVIKTLSHLRSKGARKLTLLGGEPTLHPNYLDFIYTSHILGYERITIDTNGLGRNPLPEDIALRRKLSIRLSFEGSDENTHNKIRGPKTFHSTLSMLRRIQQEGVRVEVTVTLNRLNIDSIVDIVEYFGKLNVDELNFHFISSPGNIPEETELSLEPQIVLRAQKVLHKISKSIDMKMKIRYPKLLVHSEKLDRETEKGCECKMFSSSRLLVMPNGDFAKCSLTIYNHIHKKSSFIQDLKFNGCQLSKLHFPKGIPEGFVMTCISWKNHEENNAR